MSISLTTGMTTTAIASSSMEISMALQSMSAPSLWRRSKERGISYSSEEIKDNSGVPMMNLACIDKTGFYREGELKFFSGNYSEADKVYPNDMLVACTDLTRNADIIGTPILVPSGAEFYLYTMDLAKLTPKANIDKMFLWYC